MARGHSARARTARLGEALAPESGHPACAVLDSLHANVMVADLDLAIVYANQRARRTLTTLEPTLRSTFGVGMSDLMDGSIHRFHKDPGRIEAILAAADGLPRTAVFTFGGVTLRTSIGAVTDAGGTRLGYCVVWDDVTERNQAADGVLNAVRTASADVDALCGQIVEASQANSAQATSAATGAEQLQAAAQEIARSSATISDQLREATTAAQNAVEVIAELSRSTEEIGGFVSLITDVATQSKMLALNATIEAARAGEAGRGFAVVAGEVKQLAGRSDASTSDIDARVQAIRAAAMQGAEALTAIDALVGQISQAQTSVAAATEEQTAVTSEIAAAIASIVGGVEATAAKADEVSGALATIGAPADDLHRMIRES